MKKLLSLLLALTLCLGLMVPAQAYYRTRVGNYSLSLVTGQETRTVTLDGVEQKIVLYYVKADGHCITTDYETGGGMPYLLCYYPVEGEENAYYTKDSGEPFPYQYLTMTTDGEAPGNFYRIWDYDNNGTPVYFALDPREFEGADAYIDAVPDDPNDGYQTYTINVNDGASLTVRARKTENWSFTSIDPMWDEDGEPDVRSATRYELKPGSLVTVEGSFSYCFHKLYGGVYTQMASWASDAKTGTVESLFNYMPMSMPDLIEIEAADGPICLVSDSPVFADVSDNAYYAEPVSWAVRNRITDGTSDTTFSPEQLCTNAHILTFLWRTCGKPSVTPISLSDVPAGSYYEQAASWAKALGMIEGSAMSPDTPCTRASTVMFMWKAVGSPVMDTNTGFTDVPADADYAMAVAWALRHGVTDGTSDTTFSPNDTCTRGQIVTFLHRAGMNFY